MKLEIYLLVSPQLQYRIVLVKNKTPPDRTHPTLPWQFKRGTAAYQKSFSEISLKSGDKLKVSFDATDDTGCQELPAAPAVLVGTISLVQTPTVTGNVTDGFTFTMEYEIANGDNGDISFSLTLTDGSSSSSVIFIPIYKWKRCYSNSRHNRANIQ